MARAVILTGSPHYDGASQKLADNFEKGIKEAGNDVYRYDAGLQGEGQPHFLQLEHAPGMEVGIPDNDLVEKGVIPIGGLTFDGIPNSIKQPNGMKLNSMGKPNKMNSTYKQMTGVRELYLKNHVKVLNIVGDVGDKTDGRVDNISTLSLQYLVSGGNSSYRVLKINGKNAQHSKLHENAQVDQALIKFLWNK